MNIMVFDVPAESAGALTVLSDCYNKAIKEADGKNRWYFVISTPNFGDTDTVKVLRFPWVKKSWLHRAYFDLFVAPHLVKNYHIDEIMSLHNVIIPWIKVPQILYVHQSIPFSEVKFKLLGDAKLWVYKNLIGKLIYKSIQKANRVIVQTIWMKKACTDKLRVNPEKVIVIPPVVEVVVKKKYEPINENILTFFYPASGFSYKNHEVIVDAALLLKQRCRNQYKIILTLNGNENMKIVKLYKIVKDNNLPILFVGNMTRDQVFDFYSRSILIFASLVESFGLPLLEAKLHNAPILACDTAFSHEILDGYERVSFFKAEDARELAYLMETFNVR